MKDRSWASLSAESARCHAAIRITSPTSKLSWSKNSHEFDVFFVIRNSLLSFVRVEHKNSRLITQNRHDLWFRYEMIFIILINIACDRRSEGSLSRRQQWTCSLALINNSQHRKKSTQEPTKDKWMFCSVHTGGQISWWFYFESSPYNGRHHHSVARWSSREKESASCWFFNSFTICTLIFHRN